jgi:hypothetical protein
MLTSDEAIEATVDANGKLDADRQQLDVLRLYVTGKQRLPLVIPRDAPAEVRELARVARINLIAIVVQSLVESLYVDNIRMAETAEPAGNDIADPASGDPDEPLKPIWNAWQRNRWDRRQAGLYRAVFTYGYGYAVVTPGRPAPVMRPMSPRRMVALYSDAEPDYPRRALERRSDGSFRLYDATSGVGEAFVYVLGKDAKGRFSVLAEPEPLGIPYVPVIKYVPFDDLDLDDEPLALIPEGPPGNYTTMVAGEVAPLMPLQDQTDVSSFALKSAEWYAAFRQRWVKGWTPENRTVKMRSAASQLWTFEEHPDDIELGEFSETTLDGFLRSRESVLKYAATLSQTPVHELIGELVNLSAEALAAAEAGRDRKVELAKTSLGESHEQMAQTLGLFLGVEVPENIETVWRDTSARAFGAIVDGLGKVAQMLNVPPDMLWDRIPGVTRQDVERWRAAAKEGDALGQLTKLLDQQGNPTDPAGNPNPDGSTTRSSGLILPPGARA